jgi:hypothetical protein
MWVLLNDSFFSIVHKDCERGEVLVRARRSGDIEKVFGRRTFVTKDEAADYLYRAVVSKTDLKTALAREVERITYPNFKSSVKDDKLHIAYLNCWTTLANLQPRREGIVTPAEVRSTDEFYNYFPDDPHSSCAKIKRAPAKKKRGRK